MFPVLPAKFGTTVALLALLHTVAVSAALGHVGLATTVPDHDQMLERAPTQIHFKFMAQVTITNIRLEITDGPRKGERIDIRLPRNSIGQSTAFGEEISLELPALDDATYLVTYQAISIGGDVLIDDFGFTVNSAAP